MNKLPENFSYLEEFDSTILQELRYAGIHNFVGNSIPGYNTKCIVSKKMGPALIKAQQIAKSYNLSLKIYDAYRPLRACIHFFYWAKDPHDQKMKQEFYQHIDKSTLFQAGYIALRSEHSRGAAVDLTLVPIPTPKQKIFKENQPLIDGTLDYLTRFPDTSIDMGTGFDCFHEKAHTNNKSIPIKAQENRQLLCKIMSSAGFKNYSKEWWHFSLVDEPFPNTYFDFIM